MKTKPIAYLLFAALALPLFHDRASAQVSIPFTDNFEGDIVGANDPFFTVSSSFSNPNNNWQVVSPGIASSQGFQSLISTNNSTIYNCAVVQATSLAAPQALDISSDFQIPVFSTSRRSHIGLVALGNHANLGVVGQGTGVGSFIWGAIQISATSGNGPGSLVWVDFENGAGGTTGISKGSQVGSNLPMNTNDTYHLDLLVTYDCNTNMTVVFTATDVTSNLTASISQTITYATVATWFLANSTNVNGTYFGYCDREDANGLGGPGPYQVETVLQDNFALVATNSPPCGPPAPVLQTAITPFANRFVGATATLIASFGGVVPMYYTWQYGGTNLSSTNNVSITSTNDSGLVLTNLQLTNAGYYRLFASNSIGVSNSQWVDLGVLPIPSPAVIDVDIRNGIFGAYQGQGVLGTAADIWNVVDGSSTNAASNINVPLNDSTGAATTVTLTKSVTTGVTINSSLVLPLFNEYGQSTSNQTVTLSGLNANSTYDVVVYSIGNGFQGGIISGAVNGTTTGGPALVSDSGGFTNGVNYVENKSALTDSGGNLTFSIAPLTNTVSGVFDGLQITQSTAIVLPTVSIQAVSGGQLQVTWSGGLGVLLQSANVSGPYTTNNATSPYTFTPTGAQMFFRAQ